MKNVSARDSFVCHIVNVIYTYYVCLHGILHVYRASSFLLQLGRRMTAEVKTW